MTIREKIEALKAAGYEAKAWGGTGTGREERIYVRQGGRDLGYLVTDDDGSTGTCRGVKRSGDIARILRESSATADEA